MPSLARASVGHNAADLALVSTLAVPNLELSTLNSRGALHPESL